MANSTTTDTLSTILRLTTRGHLAANDTIRKLQEQIASDFATRNGWRISSPFASGDLASLTMPRHPATDFCGSEADHPVFYVDATGAPTAISLHIYGCSAPAVKWAALRGLEARDIESIEPSWYYPGRTRHVLVTRRSA
jgi:hypothetical protein